MPSKIFFESFADSRYVFILQNSCHQPCFSTQKATPKKMTRKKMNIFVKKEEDNKMEEAKNSTAQMARKKFFFNVCHFSFWHFFSSLIFAYFSIQSPAHFSFPVFSFLFSHLPITRRRTPHSF
ncbi:unnamed protein product [Meloidogyne enterolobii]|uniref:Uncharacterized protein n=1 Tax=Meloidogyne enterolobii TaxID=390850 RepID=A0ACB1A424_MELEN